MWLAFLACVPPEPPEEGGQSGTEQPEGCEVDTETAVTDPAVAVEPMTRTLEQVVAGLAGDWAGTLTETEATDVAITFDATAIDPKLVTYLEPEPDDDTGGALGAPVALCTPTYVFGLAGSLDAGARLTVGGVPTISADDDLVEIRWTADVAEVGGTLEPQFDPADYDATTWQLALSGLDLLEGGVSWHGSRDAEGAAQAVETVGMISVSR